MINKKENILLILLGVLNPILYFINPYLLLIGIMIELFIVYTYSKNLSDKVWKIYLLASMYFGVSIFNIKLYDLVIFIFVPILFIKNTIRLTKYKYNHILIMSIYLLYLTIILVFKNNINSGVSEYFRYLIGFITIIILYYTTHSIFDMKSVVKFIPILALKNIIMGLLVWFFINYFNMNKNFISSIFNVSISNTESEFRIAGFFSDPNKYFTYFLSLLVIYEFYKTI